MTKVESLAEEIAQMLWHIEGNYNREGSGPGSRFEGRTREAVQAEAVLRRVGAGWVYSLPRCCAVWHRVCRPCPRRGGVVSARWLPRWLACSAPPSTDHRRLSE